MSQNMNIINMVGQVQDPLASRSADQATPPFSSGRSSELIVSELRGKYGVANDRGHVFSANRTAVTVPVVASNLVSVFSLFNPIGSGVDIELVSFDLGLVLATTVVDTVGLYYSPATKAGLHTFTTAGVLGTNVFPGRLDGATSPRGQFYSALTHSGTPVRADILTQFGAVTSTNDSPVHKDFDGKIIVPEGVVISVAMSTAAGTASGVDLGLTWLEVLNK